MEDERRSKTKEKHAPYHALTRHAPYSRPGYRFLRLLNEPEGIEGKKEKKTEETKATQSNHPCIFLTPHTSPHTVSTTGTPFPPHDGPTNGLKSVFTSPSAPPFLTAPLFSKSSTNAFTLS